jgi:hypothetical protein
MTEFSSNAKDEISKNSQIVFYLFFFEVTKCQYNEIGFQHLDNVTIKFVNNSSQHDN